MDQETRDKVARLPAWARELIKRLEIAPEQMTDQAVAGAKKLAHMEEQYKKLKCRCDIMHELLTCAARGGHDTAKAYVEWAVKEYGYEGPEVE